MKLATNSISCRVSLIIIIGLALITVTGTAAATPSGLVLWNKLGSQSEIQNSEVGLDGTFSGGSFVAGMFGNAYSANYNEDLKVTFPKEVIPINAGTIEFWAKLTGAPSNLDWWNRPYFVSINDGYSDFAIGLNGNDGAGNGGLVGRVGHIFTTGTGLYGSWTYEQVLGAGKVGDWHHYALVWDKDGIPGVGDGTKKVAVFLDGQLNSGRWQDYFSPSELVPLTGGKLGLIYNDNNQGSVAIDNLKIWNYAKTDFSDRFVEGGEIGGEISGMKFNDLNGNGIHDAGELGLANWTITLTNESGGVVTNVTDASGNYSFTNLTEGNYTVGEVIQPGWIQTAPAVSNTGSATYNVQISGGNTVTGKDFGNFHKGKITGRGWITITGDPKATFKIMGQYPDASNTAKGRVEYQDHNAGLNVKSIQINTVATTLDKKKGAITGLATVNGAGSYPFIVYVEDNAETGKGADVFKISLPTYPYSNGAILSGGNIQIHS